MTGSSPKTKLEQLRDFMTRQADDETRRRIWAEIQDPESPLGLLFNRGPELPSTPLDVLMGSRLKPEEDANSAGNSLRRAREAAGMTLAEAVDAILAMPGGYDITEEDLEDLEAAETPPRLTMQVALATAYSTSLPELNPRKARGRQAALLRSDQSDLAPGPHQGAPVDEDEDVKRELMDFVSRDAATEMLDALQQGNIDEWLEAHLQRTDIDEFQKALTEALVYTSLTARHGLAEKPVDRLLELAGNDPRRQLQASYLQGRQRWYVKAPEAALSALRRAYALACDLSEPKHQAHCLIYLARLEIVYPGSVNEPPEQLLSNAEKLAEAVGRADIKALALRAKILRLRVSKEIHQAAAEARKLLGDLEDENSLPEGNIKDSVRIELGLALRRFYTEKERQEAEKLYDRVISRRSQDSHSGICHYLKADLEVDRMLEVWQDHLHARQQDDAEQAEAALAAGREHHRRALDLCRQAYEMLREGHDIEALQKAVRRLTLLETMDFPVPETPQAAVDEYAVREHHLTQRLVGSPLAASQERYQPAQPLEFSRDEFRTLLAHFLGGMVLTPDREFSPDAVDLERYLGEGNLLCLPWHAGDHLLVRLFKSTAKAGAIRSVGAFRITRYRSQLQPVLSQFLGMSDSDFIAMREQLLPEFQTSVETIDHIGHADPLTRQAWDINRITILMPRSNYDWMCPVEWLRTTDPKTGKLGPTLLELANDAVVYAGSAQPPLPNNAQPGPKRYQIFSSQQQLGDATLSEMAAAELGSEVTPFVVGGHSQLSPSPTAEDGVIIIAHSDPEGRLAAQLSQWKFSEAQTVVLLFCASSHYQRVSGPMVDGPVLAVREKLGERGVVVASRVPVEPEEAFRLARELQSQKNQGTPVETVITQYLRRSRDVDPFQVPWVVVK